MTSQIVLINQAGIGIASDTLVSREEGSNRHKTFPSSNKIYELGGDHKVVVLHSGSTMIGGINYGLLIREWALQQTNPLPALADYPRQFENWLSNYRKLSIDEENEIYDLLCSSFGHFSRSLTQELQESINLPEYEEDILPLEIQQELVAAIKKYAENIYVDEKPFSDLNEASILKTIRLQERGVIEHFIEHLALVAGKDEVSWEATPVINEAVEYFVIQRLLHWNWNPNQASLNFVGFGSDEPIGGRVEVEVCGFYLYRLRTRISSRDPEASSSDVYIGTIAQDEAMSDFIRGLDRKRQEAFNDVAREKATEIFLEDGSAAEGSEKIEAFVNSFDEAINHSLWENYTLPFRRTLRALSLHSLVLFSEALVKLQSLRSATAPGEATVGGIIESLSIDRVQGIEWHTRSKDTNYQIGTSPHPFM